MTRPTNNLTRKFVACLLVTIISATTVTAIFTPITAKASYEEEKQVLDQQITQLLNQADKLSQITAPANTTAFKIGNFISKFFLPLAIFKYAAQYFTGINIDKAIPTLGIKEAGLRKQAAIIRGQARNLTIENNYAGQPNEIAQREANSNTYTTQEIKTLNDQIRTDQIKLAQASGPGCAPSNFSTGACIFEATSYITGFVAWVVEQLSYWSNELFNVAIKISVLDFPLYASMPAINMAWQTVRDVINLFFIFILLYIAISVILQVNGADSRRLLSRLIIAALLINFSIVIPKVVIDISNVFATQFYQAAGQGVTTPYGAPDVTTRLVAALALDRYDDTTSSTIPPPPGEFTSFETVVIADLGKILMFSVTTFVFLAGAAMFILRSFILLFLIITSPAAVIGFMVPQMANYSKQWWNSLISQSLFAPVMLFLMLITINIAADSKNSLMTQLSKSAAGANITTFFYFVILTGMMLGSFIAAKNLGAVGAGVAAKYGNRARTWVTAGAGVATFGLAAAAGRNTIGRWANRKANDKDLIDRAAKGSIVAKMQLQTARRVAKSSFDARTLPGVKTIAKDVGLGAAGGEGGFEAKRKAQIKKETDFVKGMTDEQQQKYAESLAKRRRFWVGWVPEHRRQAAEKIGDLEARRGVDTRNEAIKVANQKIVQDNDRIDRQVTIIKTDPSYVSAKQELERQQRILESEEDSLANHIKTGAAQGQIDNARRMVERRRALVEAHKRDADKYEKQMADLEKTKQKTKDLEVYKKKEKSWKDQYKEAREEEKAEEKSKKPSAGGSTTPSTAPTP